MAKMIFTQKKGRVRSSVPAGKESGERPVEEVVREMKERMRKPEGENYRERSLAIHGLICAHCGREFDHTNRHLLTVHHKDGNHHNNPPDGSNWENLCVYCHENEHSRDVLGDYLNGGGGKEKGTVIFDDCGASAGMGVLADKFNRALNAKKRKK